MCERYVVPDQVSAEREFVPGTAWWRFSPRFNVAPAQYVPSVRLHDGRSEGVMMRWGLIPSWFEGRPDGPPKTWVPHDAIENSKLYRSAWLAGQRCILPVAGFYSWQLTPEKYRQPYFAGLMFRSVFGVAAVWDRWVSEDDDVIESCSMVCVPVNPLLADITLPGRGMPAILRRRDYDTWLQGSPAAARATLRSYEPHRMQAYPVSPRVNSSDVDDPALIRVAS